MQERYVLKQVGYMKLEEIDYACCATHFRPCQKAEDCCIPTDCEYRSPAVPAGQLFGQTPAHNRATWLLQNLVVLGCF